MKRLELRVPLASLVALFLCQPVSAVDHNNLDAGRPLSFDDAESIAFREQALEGGLFLRRPDGLATSFGLDLSYLYGIARNTHLSAELSAYRGSRSEPGEKRSGLEKLDLGIFHSFNREHGETPAFAARFDIALPVNPEAAGIAARIRGIMSKTVGAHDRLHVNADLEVDPNRREGRRGVRPALTLGWSRPLGYPRTFHTTGLAELRVASGGGKGQSPILSAGAGLRRQISVRSVLDVGVSSDLAGGSGKRDLLRVTAGLSTGF
ncbi:MAG: hypothetical protein JNK60_11360 [Acidobacteria bacterium]|nr:hypothetical protein [Acidobacteriota bacterium]